MSQRGTPFVIGGAIIVAGILVALAIVFAPQISGLWRQADPKDSKDDRSAAKSDSPSHPTDTESRRRKGPSARVTDAPSSVPVNPEVASPDR